MDADGDPWVATPQGLAHRTQPDGWWTLHTADGLPTGSVCGAGGRRRPALCGLAWTRRGMLWRQRWGSTGVVHVDGAGDITRVDLPPDQAGMGVHALAVDPDGGLWLATHDLVDKRGVGNWQPQGVGVSHRTAGGQWSHYRPDGERHLDAVRGIAVDGEGTAWFATDNGLVARQQGGQWQDVRDGLLSLDVQSVAAGPDGRLWITTAAGVQRLGPRRHLAVVDHDQRPFRRLRVRPGLRQPGPRLAGHPHGWRDGDAGGEGVGRRVPDQSQS